jgi:hypothetical protein
MIGMLSSLKVDYKGESVKRLEKHYSNLTLGDKYQHLTGLLIEVKAKIKC